MSKKILALDLGTKTGWAIKSQNQITSVNVQQFSESLISSTTNCSTGTWPSLSSFSEVIDKCYNSPSEQCSEGKSVCAYLNETIPSIISSVWNIAPESAYNGASFSSIFKDRISGEEKEFLSGSSGNCTSDSLGGESIFPDSRKKGNFIFRISICLNNK